MRDAIAAPRRGRPLVRTAVLFVVMVAAVLVEARSNATPAPSLHTTGDNAYVEQIRFDGLAATTSLPQALSPAPTTSIEGGTAATVVHTTDPVAGASPRSSATDFAAATTVAVPAPPTAQPEPDAAVTRALPDPQVVTEAPAIVSPWAGRSTTTSAGYVATDVGCATGTSASALDAFFRERMGPVLGLDYQHVYPLGGTRYLWLFQDTFIDYSGLATNLDEAAFTHNTAMVQDGACFTLYHRGAINAPTSFEDGTGENWKAKWWWPMGGQTIGGEVFVFWAQMEKDGFEPTGPDGLGWHPVRTWLAVYDATTLERLAFAPAPNAGVSPIYGYAVDSDAEYTYLFGNTFEQNLVREGGFSNGPHSATQMFLARVPLGQFGADPEYRSGDTWTSDPTAATPITQRAWVENPMQPRYLRGQWVAATKVDGYWGESVAIDVANDPWGPWTTVEQRSLAPRGGDPLMNTYQAHLLPWLDPSGTLVVSVSENARDMRRDAWPNPARYRLMFFRAALVAPPPREDPTTTTTITTIVADPTTTTATTTTTPPTTSTTTMPVTTTEPSTTTTSLPASTTTTQPPTSTTVDQTTTSLDATSTSTSNRATTTSTSTTGG